MLVASTKVSVAVTAPLDADRRREAARLLSGYVVWGLTGSAIAVPELWAALDGEHVPWPTISGTVGYLEYWHDWVAVIVIAVLVWGGCDALLRWPRHRGGGRGEPRPGRFTLGGRDTQLLSRIGTIAYYVVAVGSVIAGALVVHALRPDDKFLLGEVLYGLMALFGVVVPALFALLWAKEVPFTPLSETIQHLVERVRPLAIVVAAGIVVLLVHLALYPWPAVTRDLQDLHRQNQKQRHAELKRKEPSPYTP